MHRRDFTIVAVLVAAIGAAALGVVLLLRGGGKAEAGDAARGRASDATDATATSTTAPAARAGGPPSGDASSPRADATSGTTALREPEPVAEVEFPGLIEVRSRPPDAPPEDGTLVLRNADPAAPPLHLEIAVKHGRFRGRGPIDATVAVEKLVIADRELATREKSWRLADRWVDIEASWTPPRLLHVVEAGSGEELRHVTLHDDLHVEGDAAAIYSPMEIVWTPRSSPPGSGHDSPLKLIEFDAPPWLAHLGASPPRDVVVRAPGKGDEAVRFTAGETEHTVFLHAAASLRVQVAPWPPEDDGETTASPVPAAKRFAVVVALIVDAADASAVDSSDLEPMVQLFNDRRLIRPPPSRAPALQDDAPPRLKELQRTALAGIATCRAALSSPVKHVAEVDASGVATFDDLCGGDWVAWLDDRKASRSVNVMVVNGRQLARREDSVHARNLSRFTVAGGGRGDVVVHGDLRSPPTCRLVVHAVDAKDRVSTALDLEEIEAGSFEDEPATTAISGEVRRAWNRDATKPTLEDERESVFFLPVGIAWIRIDPRLHPDFETVARLVELVPGENEVEVALPRTQGVVVSVDVSRAVVRSHLESFDVNTLRLARDSRGFDARTAWNTEADGTPRLVHRYSPLAPGRYELTVPVGVGYDPSGVIPVEVRDGERTTIELRFVPPAGPIESGGGLVVPGAGR